ncbi:fatty acyl-AMP ligase [Variovorax paradoxus]|nr:fatty acyl-AMP ligase [Variovorax paradoxus]
MTLARRLHQRADRDPGGRSFVYLGEGNREDEVLSNSQLDQLARVVAAQLLELAPRGARVLLVFPSGLSFVVAFFACQYAGQIPVPVVPPSGRRVREAVASVCGGCKPAVALTSSQFESQCRVFFSSGEAPLPAPQLLTLDLAPWQQRGAPSARGLPAIRESSPDDVAFIQYTSGSTSAPKGVVVTHRNLQANLAMIAAAFRSDAGSAHVGWAPLYHDMGLIANVLHPFDVGALCVLMSPRRFSQEPWLWLRAISDYRARVSGGPNFAYDLCVQRGRRALSEPLDLSSWKVAFNSAEPVHAQTLSAFAESFRSAGFDRRSLYPCYGLADATLLVTGGQVEEPPVIRCFSKAGLEIGHASLPRSDADRRELVGAGSALAGETVVIVDTAGKRLAEGHIGEVWVAGPHVPSRYWGASAAVCEAAFGGQLADFPGARFLRTGDLGFLDDGELFITGRLKDMFIVRGRNIYPQDVEAIAQHAAPGLRLNANAAFAVQHDGGEVVTLIQEVERVARREDNSGVVQAIRRAVFIELDITLGNIVLLAPGQVPKTSSGKVRRQEAAKRYLAGEFPARGGVD